jgi:hypothetical protein
MRIVLPIWLAVMTISLTACTTVFSDKGSQRLRLPMGVGSGISDVLCRDIKDVSIPKRLQELGIPFEWMDKNNGLISVGPITEESEDLYSRIRQTYFLKIQCEDELTTSISGEAILEGLNATGQWVGINDTTTIEHYSMQFLQRLDL